MLDNQSVKKGRSQSASQPISQTADWMHALTLTRETELKRRRGVTLREREKDRRKRERERDRRERKISQGDCYHHEVKRQTRRVLESYLGEAGNQP